MNDIIASIKSLSWWFSVVLVGILINLISAFIKPRLDSILGAVSERRRQRAIENKELRHKMLKDLKNDPHEQLLMAISITRHSQEAQFRLMFGILLILLFLVLPGLGVPKVIPVIALMLSVVFINSALEKRITERNMEKFLSEAGKPYDINHS